MKTERQRQQELAISYGAPLVFEYRCNDGEGFAAVASTESGAFCVLNAERPGVYAECLRSYAARVHDFRIYERPTCPHQISEQCDADCLEPEPTSREEIADERDAGDWANHSE